MSTTHPTWRYVKCNRAVWDWAHSTGRIVPKIHFRRQWVYWLEEWPVEMQSFQSLVQRIAKGRTKAPRHVRQAARVTYPNLFKPEHKPNWKPEQETP